MNRGGTTHSIKNCVGIIYAGGDGKRLWPISTSDFPKQINDVFTGTILVKESYKRAREIFKKSDIYVVVTKNLFSKIFHLLDLPQEQYLIQPRNADTAMAMGVAALCLEAERPGCTAVTFYSDQTIAQTARYYQAIRHGIALAQTQKLLVTIGTFPTHLSSQFGHIKLGKKLDKHSYLADTFIEKPSPRLATKFIKSKRYVWNTGTYIWQTSVLLKLFKKYAPELFTKLSHLPPTACHHRFSRAMKTCFEQVKNSSFDQTISEKVSRLAVVVGDFHWEDIGNWKTVYHLSSKDRNGNVVLGVPPEHVIRIESANTLVMSSKKIVSLIGVPNLIVIETKDSLLICSKEAALQVKEAVKKLKDHDIEN